MTQNDARWEPATAPNEAKFDISGYRHFSHGQPTAVYLYSDARGNKRSYALRFEKRNGKVFSYLTYGDLNGRVDWHHKAIPTRRPLYNLVELTSRPSARVLVVEGEKTADAAAKIFPDHVATTSMAGALAATKTDWSPLKGRHVDIMPDNDEPGASYARSVADLARTIGATSVRVVNLDARFPKSWDVADPLPEGIVNDDLKNLLAGDDEEKWPAVVPLPDSKPSAPTLPAEMVPMGLRAWLVDASERLGLPLEFIAAPALGALATIIGRKFAVYPKRHDTWLVPPILWTVVIARPGKRKSAAIRAALAPLAVLEAEAEKDFQGKSTLNKVRLEVIKAKRSDLQDDLKAAVKSEDQDSLDATQGLLVKLAAEEEEETLTRKRYRTNDPTIERLAALLGDNPNGMLLERDELTGFLRSFDKPGREPDRGFYLECWNGNGKYQVDRMSRELSVEGLYLNIIGGSQPAKFEDYIISAVKGHDDDGLVQRFQMAVYPDFAERQKEVDRAPDKDAWDRALEVYRRLDSLDPSTLGVGPSDQGIPGVRFSPGAQDVFDKWYGELSQRLALGELEPAFESHLAKYASLMPTLALLFHLVDWASGGGTFGPVSQEATELAADWCEFLEQHAAKIYFVVTNPEAQASQALAHKILKGKVHNGMSLRDIYRHEWSFLNSKSLVAAAAGVLSACHWLRIEEVSTSGRSSEVVRLHPSLRKEGPK